MSARIEPATRPLDTEEGYADFVSLCPGGLPLKLIYLARATLPAERDDEG